MKPKHRRRNSSTLSGVDDLLDLDFYMGPEEELMKRGIYYITGEIDKNTLLNIHQDIVLKHLDSKWKEDIQIFINSVGGDCAETWALIDLLSFVKMDIRTIGIGECLSAGACILATGTPGKRVASENLTVMVHGVSIEHMEGNKPQLLAQVKSITQEHDRDIRFWIKNSKYKTSKEIEKHFLCGTDQYFTAEEALSHGIVDIIQKG